MAAFWSSLERMPGLNAIPSAWISFMGLEFEFLKAAFFRKQPEPAQRFFCEKCCYTHEIITRSLEPPAPPAAARSAPAPIIAVCPCGDCVCPDILLTPADIEIWELHWPRLGRTLCRALGLDPKSADLPLYNTRQIGSWSADAVPVFLTIQTEPEDLRTVIAELVARLQSPFILLLPTTTHVNANCRELLARAKASFFPLDSIVLLADDGSLRPAKSAGELFAQFTPQPKEPLEEDAARKAMAIVNTLDVGPPPTPVTVFRLYCGEGLSIPQVARKLHVSNATIFRRLQIIRAATGTDPKNLRRLSPPFTGTEGEM